jgi:hypothetical protein
LIESVEHLAILPEAIEPLIDAFTVGVFGSEAKLL